MKNILVIDDDAYICELLVRYLKKNGHDAEGALTGLNGKKLFRSRDFDLVLCDFRLPDSDGEKMLQFFKAKKAAVPVVIMTAYTDIRMAVKLIKSGAYDYLAKPVQPEEILALINKATRNRQSGETGIPFDEEFIRGRSQAIKEVMNLVEVVAPTDMAVLVEGETGSGKEFIAKAIHRASKRKDKPFIAVDCGAIPKELANSELFGHIKGAFTGAINDKTGVFEQAGGGTIFLDEVGNLPHENQVKLLRALQEKIITRVGDNKSIEVDIRLITATNENLMHRVENKAFREDLYHRINGFKIDLPPLRERKEDIELFAMHFLDLANKSFGKQVKGFHDSAMELFRNYEWYGNLRELQNVVNRSVLLSDSEFISEENLPEEIRYSTMMKSSRGTKDLQKEGVQELREATLVTEREVIVEALVKANYNKSKAARLLNIDRKTLYNKIKSYNIDIGS